MSTQHDTLHLIITGKVQGVFYRVSAKKMADRLGITGWVRNMPTGNVEITASGDRKALQAFVEWCKKGPSDAIVEHVTFEQQEATEFPGFNIER